MTHTAIRDLKQITKHIHWSVYIHAVLAARKSIVIVSHVSLTPSSAVYSTIVTLLYSLIYVFDGEIIANFLNYSTTRLFHKEDLRLNSVLPIPSISVSTYTPSHIAFPKRSAYFVHAFSFYRVFFSMYHIG